MTWSDQTQCLIFYLVQFSLIVKSPFVLLPDCLRAGQKKKGELAVAKPLIFPFFVPASSSTVSEQPPQGVRLLGLLHVRNV